MKAITELTRPTRCAIIGPVGRRRFRPFLLRGVTRPSSCRQTHLHIPLCLLQNPSSWQRRMNSAFPQNRWEQRMTLSNPARHTAVSDPNRRFGPPQTAPITFLLHRLSMRRRYIPPGYLRGRLRQGAQSGCPARLRTRRISRWLSPRQRERTRSPIRKGGGVTHYTFS